MGKSRIQKLYAAGFTQPIDLLLHFPYRYADLRADLRWDAVQDGAFVTVCGTVKNEPKTQFLRKGLRMVKVLLNTAHGEVEAVWFNQKYVLSAVPYGKYLCVCGKAKKFRNKVSVIAPVILQSNGKNVIPIYRPIPGIPQRVFSEAVDMLLSCAEIRGYIPDNVRQKYGLPSLWQAFSEVHRPRDIASAEQAARALSLEKLSYTIGMFGVVKSMREKHKRFTYGRGAEDLQRAVRALPFTLTEGQASALREIVASMDAPVSMNRLLQGDVGCGKTIVALLVMYYAFLNGHQSVLMAPTEILATQHYRSAIRFLEPLGIKAVLYSGSLRTTERNAVLFAMRTHSADVIIGTHALLGEDVRFADVSLIVTDEQQRFGVHQRGALENKSPGADTLVMTATPIPRTLALGMYGELEQTLIGTLPTGRPEIVTSLVRENKIESMYAYLAERAERGEQSYIVCARIENDDAELVSAEDLYAKLARRFPSVPMALLHGKMKDAEKSEIMGRFRCGKTRILVATTVIEVGIDVPAAANIVICNPERYGLSQLHQLRGRVGRGTQKSYCFLPIVGDIPSRLQYFCGCNDGFALSEYDFEQRGAGDFIGTRQHGESGDLPVKIDAKLIAEAKAIAEDTLQDAQAVERLKAGLSDGAEQYVRSITMN